MTYTQEERCLLWLSAAEISAGKLQRLIERFGGAAGIWDAFPTEGEKLFEPGCHAVLSKLRTPAQMDDFCARIEKLGATVLFLHSTAYPDLLRQIDDPPYCLYAKGDIGALALPCIAVVGTREPDTYGREMSHRIASELAEVGLCVVSGMAKGIDACAHRGALDAGGRTVAFLGSGVDQPYPAENTRLYHDILDSGSLLLSEYPMGAAPMSYHFPYRNRLISGLCYAIVFVQGLIRSGGMHTVSAALAQGREVFAVPGRVGTMMCEGPHQIIREGARMVTCGEDVLEDLGLLELLKPKKGPKREPPNLTSEQARILNALKREPMTMDELQPCVGLPQATLQTELGMMEIQGLIRREAGNRFTRA